MKTYRNGGLFSVFGWICVATAAISIAACRTPHVPVRSDVLPGEVSPLERIRISAISEFVSDSTVSDGMQIKTLVELFDADDSVVKSPCVFRFEFYEFRPMSSDPRGHRLLIWPEQDLSDSDTNDEHWNEFLLGYEFFLPLELSLQQDKKYILEVTCLVNQKRYSDVFKMQYLP
ncbi:MAG: hypothetical protein ACYSN8_02195 [Planctomycetota bacterium]|jgi:hypothetical protein